MVFLQPFSAAWVPECRWRIGYDQGRRLPGQFKKRREGKGSWEYAKEGSSQGLGGLLVKEERGGHEWVGTTELRVREVVK